MVFIIWSCLHFTEKVVSQIYAPAIFSPEKYESEGIIYVLDFVKRWVVHNIPANFPITNHFLRVNYSQPN
jgi:hypothetical protein